ncbi:DsbA family protein [Intestinirhabdus alba]|jgi:thiol:disulfide interchange protein DsbA|uniref:Thioredoxin domain-containing protein n=1 Tax=Intestinirhabdus alba TaxID=2899544 RepID=A0A6L6IJX0_9ENTR|nr:DsbA family protein [Intestinirhabdus alba]MTH47131.1 thioredoxin domain-containing protein [Intestinirhabdus alba]
MVTQFKRINIIGYSLLLVIMSSLLTILFYHIFVFNTFAAADDRTQALREVTAEQVATSPITETNSIIEVLSYGCHYCAEIESNMLEFARTLPSGSTFKTIHIASDNNDGLAAWASLFATLEEMGIEDRFRDSAWNAVLARNINLADEEALTDWLNKNDIDVETFRSVRRSDAVNARLKYMKDITRHYAIDATPVFIINKRYVVAQDSDFPEFARRLRQLLSEEK